VNSTASCAGLRFRDVTCGPHRFRAHTSVTISHVPYVTKSASRCASRPERSTIICAACECAAGAGMLPSLARAGRAPLRRIVSTTSSPRVLSPRAPYAISSGGGSNLPPLLLPLYACSSPSRDGACGPAPGARRGMSFCARAVDVGDETPSSSAAAGSDLSAPYLSVRIRCRKEDAVSTSRSLRTSWTLRFLHMPRIASVSHAKVFCMTLRTRKCSPMRSCASVLVL